MRILITGGAGFIGSHLVDRLMLLDHEITVLDNLKRGRLSHLSQHLDHPRFRFVEGDIREYDSVFRAMENIDIVCHLAAQSNVLGAVSDIDYSFQSNVAGTFNVLKGAQKAGIKRFVFSSSREVYGEARYLPVDETHPLNSKNLYGASKIAGEKYCDVFRNMDAFELVILRFANVYGARDFNRVIPIFIENVRRAEDIRIYGGEQVIDFISVEIAVNILIQSLLNPKIPGEPVNVGSGKGVTLFELAERIKEARPSKSSILVEPARTQEVVKFIADINRMKNNFEIKIPDNSLYHLSEMLKN